jgi:tetratricopeptide (TPR) repeat protein
MGCAETTPFETVRFTGGQHVAGRYVSPSAYQHYIQALLFANEDRHDRAAAELREAIVSDPDDPDLRARLAHELVKLGQIDAAESEARQALRLGNCVEAYLSLAEVYRGRNDLHGAVAALEQAVHADVSRQDSYLELARAQHQAGDLNASRATLADMAHRFPDSVDAHYHYANALAGVGDLKNAAAELRRGLDIDPSHSDSRVRLAEVLLSAGKPNDAIEVLRDGLDRSDDNLPVAEPLVDLLLRRGDIEGARDVLATTDRDESDPVRDVAVANMLRSAKQPARARELVDAALRRQPEFGRARLLSAALYEDASDGKSALAEYSKVGDETKEYPDAVRHSAQILYASGKLNDATRLSRAALAKHPDDEDLLTLAAEFDEKSGDLPGALKRLEAAVARQPRNETLLYALGQTIDHTGDWHHAVAVMQGLLKLNPTNAGALNFIGYAYADRGIELVEAERLLRRAMAAAPGNGFIEDSLGWCLFKQGKVEAAVEALAEATELAPDEPEILRHLGDAYAAAKDRPHAAEAYRKALAVQGVDDRTRQAVESALHEVEADRSARRP